MPVREIKIKIANKTEIDKAFSLLKDSALWLKDHNIYYWQNWINPSQEYIDWIIEGFDSKQFYFVYMNSKIVGMFRLQWEDKKFWGDREDDAGYIHSLTTDRSYYRQGIGKLMLKKIEVLCKTNNKKYLRLDCESRVEKLCKYYEEYGFIAVEEICIKKYQLRLYEKKI